MISLASVQIMLSPEGLDALGDEEPSVFATWEFYEYEIQATPVMKGPRSEFQFTSQYLVKVDDFFLHYIQKVSVRDTWYRVLTAQGKQGKWPKKNPCQGKHREFGNVAKTQGIWFTQVVNTLILKVKYISVFGAKISTIFLKLVKSA